MNPSFRSSLNNANAMYRFCVQYLRLNEIYRTVFSSMEFRNGKPNEVNIFLNLNRMLSSFSADSSELSSDFSLASNIINIAGHYKKYFSQLTLLPVKVHLIYGAYSPSYNRSFLPNYNFKNLNKINERQIYSKGIIKDNLEIISTLTDYLPGLYYNTTKYEPGVLMYHIINMNPDSANIIIDDDQYNYQLASDRCCIIRPKKSLMQNKTLDISYVVNRHNSIYTYCKEKGMKITLEDLSYINNELYSLFLTINGTSLRDLPPRGRHALKTVSILETAIHQNAILNKHNSLLPDSDIVKYFNTDSLYENYCVLDIPTQYGAFLNSIDVDKLRFNDIIQKREIHEINNKYFRNNPIILDNF